MVTALGHGRFLRFESQAQIFGVGPQSEISRFAAEKLSPTFARVNGYVNSHSPFALPRATGCNPFGMKTALERQTNIARRTAIKVRTAVPPGSSRSRLA